MNLLISDEALIRYSVIYLYLKTTWSKHNIMSKHRHGSQSWIIGQDSERQDDSVTDKLRL